MSAMHALQLPEILVLIASHLDPSDLASACRVSRTWFVPFASQLWSEITSEQYVNSRLRASMPRYATYIKYLDCDTRVVDYDTLEYLPIVLCPGLTHLVSFQAPSVFASNVAQVSTLLEQNQHGLKTVLVLWGNPDLTDTMLATLMLLNNLTSLTLTTHWMPTGAIERLLDRMPYLKYLKVEALNNGPWDLATSSDDASDSAGEASALMDVISWPPSGTTLRLQTVLLLLASLASHPFLEMVRASPDLEMLDLYNGRLQRRWETIAPSKVRALAHALHHSCLKLRHLEVGGFWVDEAALYQILGLVDSSEESETGLPSLGKMSIQTHWLALKTLHLDLETVSCTTQLRIVVEASEALKNVVEVLRLTSQSSQSVGGSEYIATILCTFTHLTSFLISPAAIVRVEDLLQRAVVEVKGAKTKKSPTPDVKEWACHNLEHLKIALEGEESWCPSVGVDGPDYNFRERERKRALGKDYIVDNRYPLYYRIKTFLDRRPKLDQRKIEYQYYWAGHIYQWCNN